MDKLLEMRRAKTAEKNALKELLDTADGENRNLTDEEVKQYDNGMKTIQTMKAQEERYIQINSLEAELEKQEPNKQNQREGLKMEIRNFETRLFWTGCDTGEVEYQILKTVLSLKMLQDKYLYQKISLLK